MTRALIIVDVQNDFCEGGSLGVEGGHAVAEAIARHVNENEYDLIVTTQDWHITPGDHFATEGTAPNYQTTWPAHCVAGTAGAALHDEIVAGLWNIPADKIIEVKKGQNEAAYSGFEGTLADGKMLAAVLKDRNVAEVDITGIATDYCVLATATDARDLGLKVNVITQLCAGVDPETSRLALDKMRERGVEVR